MVVLASSTIITILVYLLSEVDMPYLLSSSITIIVGLLVHVTVGLITILITNNVVQKKKYKRQGGYMNQDEGRLFTIYNALASVAGLWTILIVLTVALPYEGVEIRFHPIMLSFLFPLFLTCFFIRCSVKTWPKIFNKTDPMLAV